MMFLGYFLAFVLLVLWVGLLVMRRGYSNSTDFQGNQRTWPLPGFVHTAVLIGALFFGGVGTWYGMMFYAEPGYIYHVRTITGQEKVISDTGWNAHVFGRINSWKRAMSIVAKEDYAGVSEDDTSAEKENVNASATLGPVRTIFLDQVDAKISATARFLLPTDREAFLRIAREYRTPDNLLRTTLLPAFRETLQANAALMGAEDYYAGGRTQFISDFEDQLESGLFMVRRKEVLQSDNGGVAQGTASANASLEDEQRDFGNDERVVFVVEKITDAAGVPVRKLQSYADLGIVVVESRITDVVPNAKFNERMQLKQKASADRAIAREQRIQEEEQRLLAEARGEREVAERKAANLVIQIEKTTQAETDKQVAITEANKLKEQAEIERQRSEILLEKARLDAQAVTVAADAEAYAKEAILKADNALAAKLEAWVEINKAYADAFAKRPVPTTVFGGSGSDSYAQGTDVQSFLQLMTVKAAKDLDVDTSVKKQ